MCARPKHRGAAPEDEQLFGPKHWETLRQASKDLWWLLSRGYAIRSACELVGNRYELNTRQRSAVGRSACSDQDLAHRHSREVEPETLRGRELWIDGLNVLTAVEAAMAGGFLFVGRDGCYRDVASIHGRHDRVEETVPALRALGDACAAWELSCCRWYIDRPVSNSGRLKTLMLRFAAENRWRWEVELVMNPDKVLSETQEVVATADSAILDRCQGWTNLTRWVVEHCVPGARRVDLSK